MDSWQFYPSDSRESAFFRFQENFAIENWFNNRNLASSTKDIHIILANKYGKMKINFLVIKQDEMKSLKSHQGDAVVSRADWLVGETDHFDITLRRLSPSIIFWTEEVWMNKSLIMLLKHVNKHIYDIYLAINLSVS